MKENNLKLTKKGILALLLSTTTLCTTVGCATVELAPTEDYDVVSEQIGEDGKLTAGLTQILDVPGENFKLVTEYSCDDASKREWRVTSDKFLYIKAYTENLDPNTLVYIDNIHIDTTIKSRYAAIDGILQDTMDDHVHSSQMIGFYIDNDSCYYGVNAIEGCNDQFISGTFYGYNGYSAGTIKQERYTESDYRELGVYANKFQIVYDLLVKGENDKDFKNVSVKTDFLVNVSQSEIEYGTDKDIKEKNNEVANVKQKTYGTM